MKPVRQHAEALLKTFCKIRRGIEAAGIRDLLNRFIAMQEKITRVYESYLQNISVRSLVKHFFEKLYQMIFGNMEMIGYALDGNIFGEVF